MRMAPDAAELWEVGSRTHFGWRVAVLTEDVSLATRVAELTPGDLNRIFFTNSGSEAVDTAMKVALAYHQARGHSGRTGFVSRERPAFSARPFTSA